MVLTGALGLWGISVVLAAYIGLCMVVGKAPTKFGGLVKRSEQPGVFWVSMGIMGVGLFVLVFLAIYASVPWAAFGW
jgi:hypothetical protein